MRKIIENIRNKPESTRRHILHGLTLFFACFLFILWIYSIGTGIGSDVNEAKVNNEANPLSVLKDNITPLW